MNQVISFVDVIKSSLKIANKYKIKVILSYLLWLITFWIPYLNIGTTIGLKKMILKMSNDDFFSPIDIFNSEHRKNIDTFLILWFISSNIIIIASVVFLFFPGYVMYFALSQIYLLFVDKNLGAMESIKESYRITYGEKWQILFSKLLGNIGLYLAGSLIIGIIFSILYFPIYGALNSAEEKHWEWVRNGENLVYEINNINRDINSWEENIIELQDKIDLLPVFEESYRSRYYGWTTRTITLDEDAAKQKKSYFNNEIFDYKTKTDEAKKSLEELNPQLETYNSNEPSEPIIDPWDFREFMNFLFLPFLIAMLVLFVFAFNASMNAYIYSKLKDK